MSENIENMEDRVISNGVPSYYVPPSGYDYLANSKDPYKSSHDNGDRQRKSDMTDSGLPTTESFQPYSADRPFIYDSYRRDTSKPNKAYPESNRQAVMTALRSLQGKIRSLEDERKEAEYNLHTLTAETCRFQRRVRDGADETDDTSRVNTSHGPGMHSKLDTAEQRCKLLEKQLESMRNMVTRAEHDRTASQRRTADIESRRSQLLDDDLRQQISKISELEREHLKLTATQTLAENKIRELEDKLREERHHRKYIQTKAAELETAAETQRILLEANPKQRPKSSKKRVKKKQKAPVSRPQSARTRKVNNTPATNHGVTEGKRPGMEPPDHYKLNIGQIPFISGKSTGPSHSLAANFQEVLSLLKTHNTKLCASPRSHTKTPGITYFRERPRSARGAPEPEVQGSQQDLTELLLQLQQEFSTMSFEHQELRDQIATTTETRLQEDLERELDALVSTMEHKGQQIAQLRKHTERLSQSARKSRDHSSTTHADLPVGGQVQVTTTIKSKTGRSTPTLTQQRTSQGSNPQGSLNLYKGLKKIQNSLRRDDISWD